MANSDELMAGLRDLIEHIENAHPQDIITANLVRDELVVTAQSHAIIRLLSWLRDDATCQFTCLIDITAVDWPKKDQRFEIIYHLLSVRQNQRIRVKIAVGDDESVPTATGIFSASGWFEREVWDLFGIYFVDHPDLRRLLTDYGFEGHPLRKDFPLTGFVETRYDEEQKRVVYEKVKLTQDFRNFDFASPWEGMQHILSNDGGAEGSDG